MINTEKKRLNKIAQDTIFDAGLDARLVYYNYLELKPYFRGKQGLELGCGDGVMTRYLVAHFDHLTAVDGSEKFCALTRRKVKAKNLNVICSLIEDFVPGQLFDTIFITHVLEHVKYPVALLKRVKQWLKKNGRILIVVPNADSLHRQAGKKMKLLHELTSLNQRDLQVGHRRVYTWEKFEHDIRSAGLKISKINGLFLKPLTNAQIDKWWSKNMMDAFYELAHDFPKIAGEIYAVCRK